jgi:hypothetical protein
MPTYQFRTESGKLVECSYRMRDVPSIGSVVEHELLGKITRVAHDAQVSPNFTTASYPYVSHALPRNLPGVKCDSKGHPIIHSRREERNVASRHGYIRAED